MLWKKGRLSLKIGSSQANIRNMPYTRSLHDTRKRVFFAYACRGECQTWNLSQTLHGYDFRIIFFYPRNVKITTSYVFRQNIVNFISHNKYQYSGLYYPQRVFPKKSLKKRTNFLIVEIVLSQANIRQMFFDRRSSEVGVLRRHRQSDGYGNSKTYLPRGRSQWKCCFSKLTIISIKKKRCYCLSPKPAPCTEVGTMGFFFFLHLRD